MTRNQFIEAKQNLLNALTIVIGEELEPNSDCQREDLIDLYNLIREANLALDEYVKHYPADEDKNL